MFQRAVRNLILGAALFVSPLAMAGEASDFTLRDINNQEVQLSDLKGKVVVLSFWATWCAPCKEEMPHLQRMYDKYKDKGFVVLSISSDDARTASRVKPFIRSKGFTFPVLLDKQSKVTTTYNPGKTLPWTVVIDRNFDVAKVHSGYNPGDEEELDEEVVALLEAKASAE
jgi:peroxiredoxin